MTPRNLESKRFPRKSMKTITPETMAFSEVQATIKIVAKIGNKGLKRIYVINMMKKIPKFRKLSLQKTRITKNVYRRNPNIFLK